MVWPKMSTMGLQILWVVVFVGSVNAEGPWRYHWEELPESPAWPASLPIARQDDAIYYYDYPQSVDVGHGLDYDDDHASGLVRMDPSSEKISWTPDGIPVRTVYPPRPIPRQPGPPTSVGAYPSSNAPTAHVQRPGPLEILQLSQQIVKNIRKKKRNKGKGKYKKKNKNKNKKNKDKDKKKKKKPNSEEHGDDDEDSEEDHDEDGEHEYGGYGYGNGNGNGYGNFEDEDESEELDDDELASSEELHGDTADLPLSHRDREYEMRRKQYHAYGLSLREIGGLPIFPSAGVSGPMPEPGFA